MERLRLAAFRDTITGLPNRLSFIAAMKKGIKNTNAERPGAVFHLIIDGYQGAGDILGTTGNQRLQADAASRLSLYLASSSTGPDNTMRDLFLASIGAGQFGVFMPAGCGREEAASLARELKQLFEEPFGS